MKRVHVVAAVIFNSDNQVLLAKRPQHLHQGGLWEFPGGKLDVGETVEQALLRELEEELAISADPVQCMPLLQISHDYPDKHVLLDFWQVRGFLGVPRGSEGQPIEWVSVGRLIEYSFPEANLPIIEILQQQYAS